MSIFPVLIYPDAKETHFTVWIFYSQEMQKIYIYIDKYKDTGESMN